MSVQVGGSGDFNEPNTLQQRVDELELVVADLLQRVDRVDRLADMLEMAIDEPPQDRLTAYRARARATADAAYKRRKALEDA